jgi:uncharacterized membrane protein YgcG
VWQGASYAKRWAYAARVTWVQGEFYWRVQRDERAQVIDYEGRGKDSALRLSREQSGNEITWSAGAVLDAAAVADAFRIAPAARAALQRDAAPVSPNAGGAAKGLLLFAIVALVMIVLAQCGNDGCDEVRNAFGADSNEYRQCQHGAGSGVRTGGGSYGGWSSGGGHK